MIITSAREPVVKARRLGQSGGDLLYHQEGVGLLFDNGGNKEYVD
jgi:hypothetical protein